MALLLFVCVCCGDDTKQAKNWACSIFVSTNAVHAHADIPQTNTYECPAQLLFPPLAHLHLLLGDVFLRRERFVCIKPKQRLPHFQRYPFRTHGSVKHRTPAAMARLMANILLFKDVGSCTRPRAGPNLFGSALEEKGILCFSDVYGRL